VEGFPCGYSISIKEHASGTLAQKNLLRPAAGAQFAAFCDRNPGFVRNATFRPETAVTKQIIRRPFWASWTVAWTHSPTGMAFAETGVPTNCWGTKNYRRYPDE
jgi:hypothetical protein